MDDVILRPFEASDKAWLVAEHGTAYARDEGFDDTFGLLVASILDDFISDHDPAAERGWMAERGTGTRLGSIFCVRAGEGSAKLRLFYLTCTARGMGLGQRMLETCVGFARDAGYRDLVLWTHASHRAACALYAKNGFELTKSMPVRSFGVDLEEQAWRLVL